MFSIAADTNLLGRNADHSHDGCPASDIDVFGPQTSHVHAARHGVENERDLVMSILDVVSFDKAYTMHAAVLTASCEATKPRAAKKTPARAAELEL